MHVCSAAPVGRSTKLRKTRGKVMGASAFHHYKYRSALPAFERPGGGSCGAVPSLRLNTAIQTHSSVAQQGTGHGTTFSRGRNWDGVAAAGRHPRPHCQPHHRCAPAAIPHPMRSPPPTHLTHAATQPRSPTSPSVTTPKALLPPSSSKAHAAFLSMVRGGSIDSSQPTQSLLP